MPERTAGEARPAPRRRGAWGAPLVVVSVLLTFFLPALLGGDQFLFRDNGRMHWPVKQYLAERLRRGELPEWNPYAGLGIPLIGTAVDAVQHPFNALFLVAPFPLAFKLWGLLSFLLAALGALAWARRLELSTPAAVGAALAFALSGPLVGSSDNYTYLTTMAAMPWLFAAAHGWAERPGPGRLVLVGLASWLCAAGGDPQAWGFGLAGVALHPLLLPSDPTTGRWRRLALGAAAAAGALVGAAPVVLPVIAWLPESSRGAVGLDPIELQRWNMPVARLVELGLPHLFRDAPGALSSPVYIAFGGGQITPIPWVLSVYVGVTVLALALAGVLRRGEARALVAAAALLLWMALGEHAGFGQLLPHLPVLSGFRYWEKMAIWPALLLAVAAGYGVDELVAGRVAGRRFGLALLGAGGLSLILYQAARWRWDALVAWLGSTPERAAAAPAFAGNLSDGLLESGVLAGVLGLAILAIARGLVRRGPAALLALVVVADVFAANVRGYLLADPAIVDQPSPFAAFLRREPGLQRVFTPYELTKDRFQGLRDFEAGWLWAGQVLEASFNVPQHVGNVMAYTGMIPARLERFNRRLNVAQQLPHLGLWGVGFLAVPGAPEKAVLTGLRPPFDVAAVNGALPAFLMRFPHRDRAYLASELREVDRRGAMEFVLATEAAHSQASVVEGHLPPSYEPPHGAVRVVGDTPERVVLEASSDRRALLILNDIYCAGWTARIDGVPAPILPANYLARGVWIEPGRHVVSFTYRTPLLREGWALLLAGIALAGLAGLALRRRRAHPAPLTP